MSKQTLVSVVILESLFSSPLSLSLDRNEELEEEEEEEEEEGSVDDVSSHDVL